MPTVADFKKALWRWVETAVRGTEAQNRTVFANQATPRPKRPYADINVDQLVSTGQDDRRMPDDEGTREVVGHRTAYVTVQTYGSDALNLAETIRSSLWLERVRRGLRDDEVAFVDATAVQNITVLVEEEYEERGMFEARFAFAQTQTEEVGWIQTVHASEQFFDIGDSSPDDSPLLEEHWKLHTASPA